MCKAPQRVVAIATQHLESEEETIDVLSGTDRDLLVLSNVVEMPRQIQANLTERFPRYRKHFSTTAVHAYFANTCACGAYFGDHFLINEPDGPFFPTTVELAAAVTVERLPFDGELVFDASWSQGGAAVILEKGK